MRLMDTDGLSVPWLQRTSLLAASVSTALAMACRGESSVGGNATYVEITLGMFIYIYGLYIYMVYIYICIYLPM